MASNSTGVFFRCDEVQYAQLQKAAAVGGETVPAYCKRVALSRSEVDMPELVALLTRTVALLRRTVALLEEE